MENTTLLPRTSTTTEALHTFQQYLIGNYIWLYISPILIAVGTVGNTLSIIVLLTKRMRKSTTMFYLTCLSVGDLCSLYTGLLRYWMRRAFDVDVRHLSDVACKIHTFLVYISLDFTVWVLVSVTVDRCICVSLPFKAKRLCSLRISRMVIVVIVALVITKNIHFLWNMKLVNTWEFRCDGATDGANHFLDYIWPWLDLTTFCLIPFTIMIVCNVKILHGMVKSQKKMNAHYNLWSAETNKPIKMVTQLSCPEPASLALEEIEQIHETSNMATYKVTELGQSCKSRHLRHDSDPARLTSSTRHASEPDIVTPQKRHTSDPHIKALTLRKCVKSVTVSEAHSKYQTRKLSSLTALLLSVNVVFLVTTSPIQAFLIGEEYWFDTKTQSQIAWHNFWWAVVNILQYLNNSVHFFLYCLTSPLFRDEFKAVFRKSRKISMLD